MKKKYFLSLVLFVFFLCPWRSFATHSAGVNLTYKCLGGNTYEISLDWYRDCGGYNGSGGCSIFFNNTCTGFNGLSCSAPTPISFAYYSPSCGLCFNDSFPPDSVIITEVSSLCPGKKSTCDGGTYPGFQKWSYKKVITLPAECSDWIFLYSNPARSVSLTTTSVINEGFAIKATLNNLAAPDNSSPSFTSSNISFLCAGQPFCFHEGTIAPAGDSLVYSLAQPLTSVYSNNYVTYASGFSYTNPFGAGSPVTLDSVTGDLCVTPTMQLVTLTDIQVSDYRNGVLIGTVTRDLEFVVTACSNLPPALSGINGAAYLSNNVDSVCVGSTLCFNINGSDPDAGDTLTMSWDSAIDSATFTVNNNNSFTPSAQFCWTPTAGDVSSNPYIFTAIIHDNACPYEGLQYYPFTVYVNNCSAEAPPVADFESSNRTLCANDCINFTDLSTNATSWQWSFAGAGDSTSTSENPQSVCYPNPGTYDVILIASNSGGSDSVTFSSYINVKPAPETPFVTQVGTVLYCSTNPSYTSYQWYDSTTIIPGATDTFLVVTQGGNYNVQVSDSNGCKTAVGINIILGDEKFTVCSLQFTVSPNPATDKIIIQYSQLMIRNCASCILNCELYNILGQTVCQSQILNPQSQIDISALPTGIYIVQVANERGNWVGKFVKE